MASDSLKQRTCISRPLPTLRTNSLKFRLVRIYHKGRVFQDHYLHWEPTAWNLDQWESTTKDVYFKTTTYTENQQFEVRVMVTK
jgi:hypothetical protein